MDVDVKIVPFTIDDEQEVMRLLSEAELPIKDLTNEKLKSFLVARREDGSVVGAIGIETYQDVGLLRSLVVHPPYRRKGLGKLLTNELEAAAREKGIVAIYLLTMTAADFFPRLGYQVTNRAIVPESISGTEEFKNLCPESAVCLYKDLGVA